MECGFHWAPISGGATLLARLIYGGRISTTVGLVGVAMQPHYWRSGGNGLWLCRRACGSGDPAGIEVLLSFPSIPLWMALSAALPRVGAIKVYFVISLILSVISWGGLARIVRGMSALTETGYVLSARMSGGGTTWIVLRHLLPANLSYVIVSVTLSIPQMILAETSFELSGIGYRPPFVSWGVLLRDAEHIQAGTIPVAYSPGLCDERHSTRVPTSLVMDFGMRLIPSQISDVQY